MQIRDSQQFLERGEEYIALIVSQPLTSLLLEEPALDVERIRRTVYSHLNHQCIVASRKAPNIHPVFLRYEEEKMIRFVWEQVTANPLKRFFELLDLSRQKKTLQLGFLFFLAQNAPLCGDSIH